MVMMPMTISAPGETVVFRGGSNLIAIAIATAVAHGERTGRTRALWTKDRLTRGQGGPTPGGPSEPGHRVRRPPASRLSGVEPASRSWRWLEYGEERVLVRCDDDAVREARPLT